MVKHHLSCVSIQKLIIALGIALSAFHSAMATDPSSTGGPTTHRAPPDAAAQLRAEQLVRDIYKSDFTKTAAADRMALARKLLDKATGLTDDPAGLYVLLRDARDEAIAGHDASTALAAILRFHDSFMIPLSDQLDNWTKLNGILDQAKVAGDVVQQCWGLEDAAIAVDGYDLAVKAAMQAKAAAQITTDLAIITQAESRLNQAKGMQQQYVAFRTAEVKLNANADDKVANCAVGCFLCFTKNDWQQGLTHLVKGSDSVLAELARRGQTIPTFTDDQVALADGWWDAASNQTSDTPQHHGMQQRAVQWYKLRSARPPAWCARN